MSARVFFAAPTPPDAVERIAELEPRLELIYEPDVVPQQRHSGDYSMGLGFLADDADRLARYQELSDSADILYGFLDPAELARTVRANPRLSWIHGMMAGSGQVYRKAGFTDDELKRVVLTTAAGVHARPLAEWSVMGVLMGLKGVSQLQEWQRAKQWHPDLVTRSLDQITVLVVGMGHIGRECVRQFSALGARVVGVNRSHRDVDGLDELFLTDQIVDAAAQADAIINTLPAAVGTEHLISREVIDALPDGAILVSVGRGSAVDEQAVINALQSGRLGFAAMDVFETEPLPQSSPLWDMDNVVIASHAAAHNDAEPILIAELFADNARRFLDGDDMRNIVDTDNWY